MKRSADAAGGEGREEGGEARSVRLRVTLGLFGAPQHGAAAEVAAEVAAVSAAWRDWRRNIPSEARDAEVAGFLLSDRSTGDGCGCVGVGVGAGPRACAARPRGEREAEALQNLGDVVIAGTSEVQDALSCASCFFVCLCVCVCICVCGAVFLREEYPCG